MRELCRIIASVSLIGLATAGSAAQDLDVVSVRESDGSERPQFAFQPGRMVWANVQLQTLVGFVFGLSGGLPREQQIEGWPDRRLAERRFTVTATYAGTTTPPLAVQRRLVRQILEDRFGMRTHIEQRDRPVYALRLVKPGVLGPGIVEVDYDCTDVETRARDDLDCRQGSRTDEPGAVDRGSGPMALLVAYLQLTDLKDRVVVDRTGLDGFYRWELLRVEPGVPLRLPLPSARELLPVQLGMTIETTRAPVDVVVIDAIAMPTSN